MGKVQKLTNLNVREELEQLIYTLPELKDSAVKALELTKHIKPQVFWTTGPITYTGANQIVVLDGQLTINSAYVTVGLKDCQRVTMLAATIGRELPLYANKALEEGRLWEGAVSDTLGSHAVEILVDKFCQYLKRTYQTQGLFSTLRFSPGYGDWPLEGQREIIGLLQAEPDISVSPNFLLEPTKSITALIGWSNKPPRTSYPQGLSKKGFCQGSNSCSHCQTWACRK